MSSRYGLRLGQVIKVEVLEVQLGGDLLVTYHGNLIRVRNSTDRSWSAKDKLNLIVFKVDPIEFHIYERRRDSLNLFI